MADPATEGPDRDRFALSERLADELQRRIFAGEIPVGAWLRHGALAEEYGTSRTPVREALRMLQVRGLIEIERHRGARVKGPSPRDLRELAYVRADLEGYAAALAAERIRDSQLERLDVAWRGYRTAVEAFIARPDGSKRHALGEKWVKANHEFHQAIQDAAGNRQLRIVIEDIYRRLPPNISYAALSGDSRLLLKNVDEHERIAASIRARDGAAARLEMEEHIRSAADLMIRWFEQEVDGSPGA